MSLLRIDATIKPHGSSSEQVADLVEQEWRTEHPGQDVVRRHLGLDPLPADAWAGAVSAGWTPEDQRSDAQRAALTLARELVRELADADAVLLTAPLYNYGLSQHVKMWVDLVMAGGDLGERHLDGKPVVLVATRGGSYAAGTPREGWDHSTPYLRHILADTWGADLTLVEREWTLVGVNPALDAFEDVAAEEQERAHGAARRAGRSLGVPVAA